MSSPRHFACLVALLLVGCALRFVGLTRGSSDFVPSGRGGGPGAAFYHFHPDEDMVLRAALEPVDPLEPAFTVYGLLPVYALRGALAAVLPTADLSAAALADPGAARRAFVTARALAALTSCLTLVVAAWLGWHCFGPLAGCLATAFAAFAPGAIQQGHFYIVDGPFGLLSLAALGAILAALERGSWRWYAGAGLLIGATAAVKLTGLLLGPVLLVAHLQREMALSEEPWPQRLGRGLLGRPLWLAGGLAALTLVALEPYLVVRPDLIFRARTFADFAASAQIAAGDVLRPWTLVDVHSVAYLHHWTHLFPLVVGWPLTLAFLAGLVHAGWRRSPASLVALTWVGLYFGLIGGLHAKPVRYLVPLVPVLAWLAADLLARLCHRRPKRGWRLAAPVAAAGVVAWTAAYGTAFAGIYAVEDSRLRAARWIVEHVPAGERIVTESGGFALARLVSPERYDQRSLHDARCFAAREYLTCRATWRILWRQLRQADYLAVVDANRLLHFTAVPDLLPAAADFYHRLLDGELGFEVAARFDGAPVLAGVDFSTDAPEPSFVGYDHPTVYLLRRGPDVDAAWDAWWARLEASPACPDRDLSEVLARLRAGDLSGARTQARATSRRYPHSRLTSLLEALAERAAGGTQLEGEAIARYQSGYSDPSQLPHLIPWASGWSMLGLGAGELLPTVMRDGYQRLGSEQGQSIALQSIELGGVLEERGLAAQASDVYALATEVFPTAEGYAALGRALHDCGDLDGSSAAYARTLELDSSQVVARSNLAWNLYQQDDFAGAVRQYRQLLDAGQRKSVILNLALALLANRDEAAADSLFAAAAVEIGPEAMDRLGVPSELRALADRGHNAEAVGRVLRRYWPAGAAPPGPGSRP